ncbi:putative substrate-binding transport protein [Klebsiella pneumoniae]|uniref:Putative substrate-binding transport protein n=1 Tax=Klebsiella pneumoniae TaxID=573 RepID=A0A377TZP9_KLEPN|nr:putative substrate-binding transport protein [Klebsiella pneumoniae]
MVKPLGIAMELKSGSWETVERHMHANPTLFGWGSLDPMELYHHYSSKAAGVEYYNPGYYSNNAVDQHLQQALNAPTLQQRFPSGSRLNGMESLARACGRCRLGLAAKFTTYLPCQSVY